jgi:hypothetical protein
MWLAQVVCENNIQVYAHEVGPEQRFKDFLKNGDS